MHFRSFRTNEALKINNDNKNCILMCVSILFGFRCTEAPHIYFYLQFCCHLFVCALKCSISPICANLHKFFHASAVKAPFVNMSASCSLVPTYFIYTPGSVLIRSHNQSKSIRCVLATCRIAGDRPLMHIFITASLSSKMTSLPIPSDKGSVQGT